MRKDEMISILEKQLEALKGSGGFAAHSFDVDGCEVNKNNWMGDALIRVEDRGWTWGYCTSETCAHNSHSPQTSGPTVFLTCKKIGEDRDGERQIFELPNGEVFTYVYQDSGYHFCPSRFFGYYELESRPSA